MSSQLQPQESFAPAPLAIQVKNVTVAYRSYREKPSSLKESALRWLRTGRTSTYSTFDALADVSFSLEKGGVLAVVGSNGSGKSTLLRVLSGVLAPTRGKVEVEGTMSSLVALGAGFDAELNAIENIYLNGLLHRKSKKFLKSRVDQILEFAELTEFAYMPVKYYSAGMFARLGFSVAIDIDPDVLLVDEILAVGDERFQEKSLARLRGFVSGGKTVVIVSHQADTLQDLCTRAILLSKGRLIQEGNPAEVLETYRSANYETALERPAELAAVPGEPPAASV